MVNQQLIDFIKNSLKQGYPKEQLIDQLLEKGWPAQEIENAMNIAEGNAPNDLYLKVPKFKQGEDSDFTPSFKKHSSKVPYLIIFIIIIGFISYYSLYAKAIECGTDTSCLRDAARDCKPAKGISTESGIESSLQIKGSEGTACKVKIEVLNVQT